MSLFGKMKIIEMARNTVKRRGYDSRDHRVPRLTTIAKVS